MNLIADNIIVLKEPGNAAPISPHDAAVLADWAAKRKLEATDKDTARGYSLIREGADLLLRRQALLTEK